MATARPIRLGTPGSLGPGPTPARPGPAPRHGRQASVLSSRLAAMILRTADLVPLLAPIAVGFLVFA